MLRPDPSLKVLLFDIKKFAVHDGPGIRTTLFMKGCPLRCIWCQNPEGFNLKQEVIPLKKKWNGNTNECVNFSADGNSLIHGKWFTIKEITKKTTADRQFYLDSGGGVTLSGGEPLMQLEGAVSILKELKKKRIHTAIETSGYAKWKDFSCVLEYTDLVLFDLKHMNPNVHRKLTGVPNELILENLSKISGNELILRIPIIPGYNDSQENIRETAAFIKKLKNVKQIELLPYNPLAEAKYNLHNIDQYPLKGLKPPTPERLKEIREKLNG